MVSSGDIFVYLRVVAFSSDVVVCVYVVDYLSDGTKIEFYVLLILIKKITKLFFDESLRSGIDKAQLL